MVFSAIILICTGAIDPSQCFTVKSNTFFESYLECKSTVENDIEAGEFLYIDNRNNIYIPVNYTCADWTGKKI